MLIFDFSSYYNNTGQTLKILNELRCWSLNLIYQFLVITYLFLLCSDVESNPEHKLHNLVTSQDYENRKANANLYPCSVYTNIRSVNNKHKKISNFLQQQNTQTFCFVIETWINDKQKIPLNFLRKNRYFDHHGRSKLTQLTRVNWSWNMGTKYIQK